MSTITPGVQQIIGDLKAQIEGLEKELGRTGTKNKKRLSRYEADMIRRYWKTGRWTRKQLAESFDIHPSNVGRIIRGVYYR